MVERRLSEDEAAAVLRRAAELDDERGNADVGGLELAAIERAAHEVGIDPSAVRQALAELEAGRLTSGTPRRVAGSSVTVERELPVGVDVARQSLEGFLRRQTLRMVRRRSEVSVWEPATGLATKVIRKTDFTGRLQLGDVTAITLCVVERAAGRSHARIDLDFSRMQRDLRAGTLVGAVIGGALAVGGVMGAVAGAEVALAALPAGGIVGSASWFGSRSSYATAVRRAISAVELALDDLE